MYRAVTLVAIERGTNLENEESLTRVADSLVIKLGGDCSDRLIVDEEDVTDRLRDADVERGVSLVARASGVRSELVRQQRSIAKEGPIVMVGRDIGTVVLPHASAKVYLEASPHVRARRRQAELESEGRAPDYQQLKQDILRRDAIDSQRADSPLRPADDAVCICTDDLSIEEVAEAILEIAGSR